MRKSLQVYPIHLMNVEQRQVAADLQKKNLPLILLDADGFDGVITSLRCAL